MCPVYLDVKSRLDVAAAQLAAREAMRIFTRAGDEMSRGLGANLSKAFGALDGSAARAEMVALQAEYRRTADVEAESAARIVRSMGQVEVAQRRLSEMTAKYGADSSKAAAANVALADSHARAAKAQREHVGAQEDAAAAAAGVAASTGRAADSVSNAGRVFNAVGIASVAGLGATMFETTKKAGDFQQSMTKLSAAASVPADQLKIMSDGILQMAGKVGYSTQELSGAMFDIAKSGYNGADGIKVLTAAAQGANAEQADLNEVVKALTLSMHNFKATPEEAASVMSKMVTAVGESKVPLNDFAGALHTIEPQAAQLHLSLSDVWGVLSQITASGTSADQAAEQMANTMRSLSGANAPARQAMQQLGLDADDVSQKLGQRGLAGTMQYLYDQTAKKIDPSTGLVNPGDLLKSAQAVNDMDQILTQMSPHARENAEALRANTMGHREYQMAVRGSNEQDATQMRQFQTLNDRVDGFSKRLSGGRQTVETLNQALNEETGTMSGAAIVMQTTGAHADEVNGRIKKIAATVVNADGTVKGFNETQDTLNAKMRDAHAAFGAAEAEIGSAFIPVMMSAANIAKDVGDAMAKHPAIMHGVVTALEGLSIAWLGIKAINIVSSILAPATVGLEAVTAAEGEATIAAGGLKTALLGLAGPIGIGLAVGPQVGKGIENLLNKSNWLNDNVRNPVRSLFGGAPIPDQKAGGGALNAPGPKGIDSALFWGASGEHVLTAGDVDAMGGHSGVHAFRNALHRAPGGPIGADNGGAVPIVQNPDGTITSSNPSWAHLIARESSGRNVRQGITDANSGGNEAEGYFQITPQTWAAHGGTAFARNPLSASPQQQGMVASRILQSNPSGSDWGAGLPGRESASGLLAGIGKGGAGGKMPTGAQDDPIYIKRSERGEDAGAGSSGGSGGRSGSRGGRGGGGGGTVPDGLPVALDDNMGTGGGLPGMAKWAVGFLEDLVLAPMENAVMAGINNAGGGGAPGGFADQGMPFGSVSSAPGGGEGVSSGGGGGSGSSGGGAPAQPASHPAAAPRSSSGWFGSGAYSAAPTAAGPGEHPAPAGTSMSLLPGVGGIPGVMGSPTAPVLGSNPPSTRFSPGGSSRDAMNAWAQAHGITGTAGSGFIGDRGIGSAPDPSTATLFGDGPQGHFADGGPSGTDTVPAWLTPGEDVLSTDDVSAMGGVGAVEQFRNALHRSTGGMVPQYFDGGGETVQMGSPAPNTAATAPAQGQPAAATGQSSQPGPSAPKQGGVGGALGLNASQLPGAPGGAQGESPTVPGARPDSDTKSISPGVATPGADSNSPLQGLPSSPGIGISGGLIGGVEGAAASAGDMFAPGSGQAAQIAFSELNRAASFGAQAAGIGVEGILESILPNSSSVGGDWATTIPGRILTGVSGVRPTAANTAGNTTKANGQSDNTSGGNTNIGFQLNGDQHVHSNDPNDFSDQMQQASQDANGAYPNTLSIGGR